MKDEDFRTKTTTRQHLHKLTDQQLFFTDIVAKRFNINKHKMETIEETKDEDIEENNKTQMTSSDESHNETGTNQLSVFQTRFIIIMLAGCNFLVANGVSLQGPFFPKEAGK